MEPEHFSRIVDREILDEIEVALKRAIRRRIVESAGTKSVGFKEDLGVIEVREKRGKQSTVSGISDAATIIGFGCKVVKCLPGYLFPFVKEQPKLR